MPHNDAHGPLPLLAFKEQLLKNHEILKLAKSQIGDEFDVNLAAWKSGNSHDDELLAFLEESLGNWKGVVESGISFEAAAPENDFFTIRIYKFGPLFFIHADEFNDVGYFDDLNAAAHRAKSDFEPLIRELAERQKEES